MNRFLSERWLSLIVIVALAAGSVLPGARTVQADAREEQLQVLESEDTVAITTEYYGIYIEKDGFRYSFIDADGSVIAPAHAVSGISFSSIGDVNNAVSTELTGYDEESVGFLVSNAEGGQANVRIVPSAHYAKFQVEPLPSGNSVKVLQGTGGATRTEALIWNGDTAWDDYRYEVQMKQSKQDGSSTSGVLVRYQDYNNFYHIRYHLASNMLQLLKKSTGQSLAVVKEVSAGSSFDSSKLYKLAVEAAGDQISVYLDDAKLLEYTDEQSPIASGAVGMRVYSDTTQYSGLSVIGRDGEVLMNQTSLEDLQEWHIQNGQWTIPGSGEETFTIDARTAPLTPGYGLGDFAHNQQSTNVFGITNNDMTNKGGEQRFVTNFTVFPAQGFAQVLFEEGQKRVAVNATENKLGAGQVQSIDALYYFMGDMKQIYKDYQEVRIAEGYPVYKPKYDFFEVGYEAFGSLGWNTYQTSVMEDLETYLEKDYRLKWGVVGSGFWKGDRNADNQGATTSFGIWDDVEEGARSDGLPNPRYPDVEALKSFFRDNEMNLLLGLRTNFKAPTSDGGYYKPEYDGNFPIEGVEKGYFLSEENGDPLTFTVNFPKGKVYLLDTSNEQAVDWYANGADLWGVDGFKEDTMMNSKPYRDGMWNKSNGKLMEKGYQIMVRNAAYSVPGDILRLEDTQFAFNQDRPIINALNYAASGAPNVYSDIVAGKYLTLPLTETQKKYFIRNAMWAATTPAMSLGLGPWHMANAEYEAIVKKAVDFHSMYAPYIYSAAVDSFHTGYPHTMTPLPIAYPNDEQTYQLANRTTRQYEWMLGPSMLAVPAYGQDYATVEARNVYLPEGKWIDFETGQAYNGPVTLENYSLPMDKIPVFIGGKGVVVRRDLDTEKLIAEVYPIANGGSSYTYTYPDGDTASTIVNNNADWNNNKMSINDMTTGEEVPFDYNSVTGSYSFELEPSHNYELTGGEFEHTVTGLRLNNQQPVDLLMGETYALQAEAVLDSGQSVIPDPSSLTYETDQPSVVSVNEAGEVTPVQLGEARVRAAMSERGAMFYSDWLPLTVLEPSLTIEQPEDGADLTSQPVRLSGTSAGLAELELRYNGQVEPIVQSADGSWEAQTGRMVDGVYGIQVVGKDKNGLIRLAKRVSVNLDTPELLLISDFEDGAEGWNVLNGSWAIAEDEDRSVYRGTGRGLTFAGEPGWSDYKLEADIKMANSSLGGSAGIVFRYQDSGNFYHLRFDDNRSDASNYKLTAQLYKWVNGAASKIGEVPYEFQYDTWYKLSAELEGSRIKAYVDGELILETMDSSIPSGMIGIRTYDRNMMVDNLTASPLQPSDQTKLPTWLDGTAQALPNSPSVLTISWNGTVEGAYGSYRIFINNEATHTITDANTAVLSDLQPGRLYSVKIEAGGEGGWSTDGPVVIYATPPQVDTPPDDDDDDEHSGDPGSPGTPDGGGTQQPEVPDNDKTVRIVEEEELSQGENGEINIVLQEGQSAVRLPASAARLDEAAIRLVGSGASVVIPSILLQQLAANAGNEELASFIVDVGSAAITAGQKRALGDDLRLTGEAVQRLTLSLELKNGQRIEAGQLPLGGWIAFDFDAAAADAELLGVYRYDGDAGKWLYAGGAADAGQGRIIADFRVPGLYMAMERRKSFADVQETHWAYRTLQVLSAKHIVNGVSNTEFNPSGLTTRAEFTALLVRTLGLGAQQVADSALFSDVASDAWYADAVSAAYGAGLVQGVSANEFAPDVSVTREQMAVMIVRAFEYANGDAIPECSTLEVYSDADKLSDWAELAVIKAVSAGLMQGKSADSFSPHTEATRAQTSQAIYNMLLLLRK